VTGKLFLSFDLQNENEQAKYHSIILLLFYTKPEQAKNLQAKLSCSGGSCMSGFSSRRTTRWHEPQEKGPSEGILKRTPEYRNLHA